MIQTGKKDRIALGLLVVEEFEAAREHYTNLGIADRIEMDLPTAATKHSFQRHPVLQAVASRAGCWPVSIVAAVTVGPRGRVYSRPILDSRRAGERFRAQAAGIMVC